MLVLLSFMLLWSDPVLDIQRVVHDFHAIDSHEEELSFVEKYKNDPDPAVEAYVIAIQMKLIERSYNPYSKLKTFFDGTKSLTDLIDANPDNPHLRYVRLLLQEKTPVFLNYKDKITVDMAFLKERMREPGDLDYLFNYIALNTSL